MVLLSLHLLFEEVHLVKPIKTELQIVLQTAIYFSILHTKFIKALITILKCDLSNIVGGLFLKDAIFFFILN